MSFQRPFVDQVQHFVPDPVFRRVRKYVIGGASFESHNQNSIGWDRDVNSQSETGSTNEGYDVTNTTGKNDDVKSLIPLPDWSVALSRWGLSWDFHIYGFAVLFLVLTLLSAVIFLRFRRRVRRLRIVFNTLILLGTSGIFRAVFLLIDPYGYKGQMAGMMVGIMTQAVYPLLCACYGLTQVMLLRITNVDVGHNKLRSLSCLLGCTLTYLFLVVVIETLVFYERALKLLLLVDSGCFIAWALFLGVTFICSGFRLTQYTTETKRARKELNAFSNHRRSASNATGLSSISGTTNVNNVFNVDLSSTVTTDTMSPQASTSGNIDTVAADVLYSPSSPIPTTSMSSIPMSSNRPSNTLRLSRPKLKISAHDHMMVTIATDDEDESTSSTDVDKPQNDTTNSRRARKRYKHKQKRHRSLSRSKLPSLPSPYTPVSVTDEPGRNPKPSIASKKQKSNKSTKASAEDPTYNYTSISTVEVQEAERDPRQKPEEFSVSFVQSSKEKTKPGCMTYSQASELPLLLLESSHLTTGQMRQNTCHSQVDESDNEDNESDNVDSDDSDTHMYKEMTHLTTDTAKSRSQGSSNFDSQLAIVQSDLMACSGVTDNNTNSDQQEHQIQTAPFCVPLNNEHLSSSPRENGYLADTENIFTCPYLPRSCNNSHHQPIAGQDADHARGEVSSQGSTSSHSEDDSTTSPVISERMRSNTSAGLGLFRIRQSKVVQRAVHLTYFLTFLFLFACLLQLYTVFGVYGVLGTIPRPDPWPWLIFHTIFRATEVSIGFTIAVIAYITLNHRHQRAKRRQQQQQQQMETTRDCIV